jgi:hypothetical protein
MTHWTDWIPVGAVALLAFLVLCLAYFGWQVWRTRKGFDVDLQTPAPVSRVELAYDLHVAPGIVVPNPSREVLQALRERLS